MENQAIEWRGLAAVRVAGGGYEAIIVPEFGANCVSLTHTASGAQLLRVPESAAALRDGCNVYGLPLLFPPNRLRDGRFTFEGRAYAFPINEPERGNHLHGVLSRTAFAREGDGRFAYRATKTQPYLTFPHTFEIVREYRVDADGLTHALTVTNTSDSVMPVGVGVHAALRDDGCRLRMDALCRWAVDGERLLTTGERVADEPLLAALRAGTLAPSAQPLSAQLECRPGAEITLYTQNGAWRCAPDPAYRFVMLWNGNGKQGFVCPEPQSWLADAPNVPLPYEATGVRALAPGETARFELRYRYTAD